MVQVVSVSAHTAAYAAEALKPSARVSGTAPSERTVKAIAREAEKSGDADRHSLPNVVQPPSISLFFLTAERQSDNTYQRAHEEYLQALAEYRVENRDAEDDEDAVSD